jgi:hypothetical protein
VGSQSGSRPEPRTERCGAELNGAKESKTEQPEPGGLDAAGSGRDSGSEAWEVAVRASKRKRKGLDS